jgi:DNA repair exonuclease SbcCD ATPase subunit
MVGKLTFHDKMQQLFENEQDAGTAQPDKWAAFFSVGPDKSGFLDARLTTLAAAAVGARVNNFEETQEEKERRKEREAEALGIVISNAAQMSQQYMQMSSSALSFIDERIGKLREEIAADKTEVARVEARQQEIAVQTEALETQAVALEERLDETRTELATVTKAETAATADIVAAQAEITANAEARDNGIRDDKGRLIVAQEITGDRPGDTFTAYYVMDDNGENPDMVSIYSLPAEERRAIREQIETAKETGELIAAAADLISPEELAAKQAEMADLRQDRREMFERRNFLKTEIGEMEEELTKLREEITALGEESEANATRLAELNQSIADKEAQIERAEKLAQDIRENKFNNAEELDAAMKGEFGNEWSTYYNNQQNRDMTAFIGSEVREAYDDRKQIDKKIEMMEKNDVAPDSPEMIALRAERDAVQAELDGDAKARSMVMSNDYTQDQLNAMMLERYGPEWTSWQQETAQKTSAASQVYGEVAGANQTASAFNTASGITPAEPAPEPEPAPSDPSVDMAANVRNTPVLGMAARM